MLRYFLLYTFFLGLTTTSHAQYQFTNGPADGGLVRDFIIHNEYWFVAQESFILRSADEGKTWQILADGLPQSDITPWSFAEFDGYLYVSTNSTQRILRSNDNGETWESYNKGMPLFFGVATYLAVRMVVNNNRLFALPNGAEQIRYLNPGDDGWQPTGFTGRVGNGIAAVGGDTLLASVSSAHKISIDNGLTWQDFEQNPPWAISDLGATDFLRVGDRFVVTTSTGGNNGLAFSSSGLTGWVQPQSSFYTGNSGGQKLIRIADDHILALASNAIMKSTDRGETWQEITTEDTRPNGITRFMQRLSGDRLIVGSTAGLFIYTNLGEGERQLVDLPLGDVTIFNTYSFDGGLIAEHSGTLSTYNFEANAWTRRVDMLKLDLSVFGSLFDRYNMSLLGDRVVVYNFDKAMISSAGTTASSLNEESFTPMPLPEGIALASTHNFGDTWILVGGTLRRESFGVFWATLTIHTSTDGGNTWTERTHNVPPAPAFIPSRAPLFKGNKSLIHNGKWYIPGESGFLRSDDQGQTWTRIQEGINVGLFSFDDALFMSSGDDFSHNIRKSTNDGETWADWHGGLPRTNSFSRRTHGLVQIDDALYTYNDASEYIRPLPEQKGLFKLDSANGEWSYVNEHPIIPFIPNLMLGFNGHIMAVQPNAGYWRSPQIGTSTSVQADIAEIPGVALLHSNYPNPFNPSTTIRYELHEAASVQVRVYNVLGQQVFDSGLAQHAAGLHQLEFNGLGLASGVYVYRLEVDGRVAGVRNMLLMK
jgi:photosystem II stability/assembly factor-like uncharacterized protein